jgi:molybdopterin biosynthesis enzyme
MPTDATDLPRFRRDDAAGVARFILALLETIKMLTVDQARDWLLQRAQPVRATESLPLLQALGRILAEPVLASVDVPPQDNSAMDGYALHSADGNGPCRFRSAFRRAVSRSIARW